jgi:short-subunit dehydrogenase
MTIEQRPLAVVTGASSGIGYELARCCAQNGYDLLIVADEPEIEQAAARLRETGASVEAVEADLATQAGVDELYAAIGGRSVGALLANAGRGLGHAFLDQEFDDIKHVIDTNVTGTLYLIHRVGRDMRAQGSGRILITGSIAGFMPGTYQAVYNGTKALLDSFAFALRAELKDSGVTVTCLMPGATETEFFERADLLDTKVGASKKQPADEVAKQGFEAMQKGDGDVVTGWNNKLRQAISLITPSGALAEMHRKMAEPGSAYASENTVDEAESRAAASRGTSQKLQNDQPKQRPRPHH